MKSDDTLMDYSFSHYPNRAVDGDARSARIEVFALRRILAQNARLETLVKAIADSPSAVRRPFPMPDIATAEPITLSHVDAYEFNGSLLHVRGWAVVANWDPLTTTAWLLLEGRPRSLTLLAKERRPDVAAALVDNPAVVGQVAMKNFADCGYRAMIDLTHIAWERENTVASICLMCGANTAAVRITPLSSRLFEA